jgi:hypothetical protein
VRWLCWPFTAVRFSYGDPLGLGQGRAVVAHSPLATRQVGGLRDGSLLCGDGERAETMVSVGKSSEGDRRRGVL